MMKTKKKNLKELKELAESTLITLQPRKGYTDKFEVPFVNFEGYTDLFATIEALLKVCVLATQEDQHRPPFVKSPIYNIRLTLELACKLMPFEEGEFLDKAYKLF
ncbi:hypothetical protein [Sinomicrobium weinanense]|uniref:Uncharacterized protein n=1 Tax=Sinomicrobium weinanense TaxID=2842200 RepID=A0A926JW50_9FLAO|nr:hypothetical protein [Sinomicrobium weinanense]MBC9798282.1 hypothetical protein [Sinomicrobium weinanense]MBU3125092.1 hypothetical protein [Sinomicrobium weinanense]